MGQATMDLPDPLDAKPSVSPQGTDDLLSQMAGDEIDRLLAESDVASGADEGDAENPTAAMNFANTAPASRGAATSPLSRDGDSTLESELDGLLGSLDDPEVAASDATAEPATAAPRFKKPPASDPGVSATPSGGPEQARSTGRTSSPQAGSGQARDAVGERAPAGRVPASFPDRAAGMAQSSDTDEVLAGELDQLLDNMSEPTTAPADSPLGSTEAASHTAPTDASTSGGSIDLQKVLDPIVAEDAAKAEEAAAGGPHPAHPEPAAPADQDAAPADERVPILVRLLEWVNAPMGWLSPAMRDAAGKVGILTLINATAILVYVLLFRRK